MSPGLAPAKDDAFPRPFGEYLLVSHLASGGMGDVYLAKMQGIAGVERPCVLKTLRDDMADDSEYVARFVDEARITVQLTHKNICQVFDVGRVNKTFYLAMELISGKDLRTLWERGQATGLPISEGLAVFVVVEVLEALDYAHRRADPSTGRPLGIVHRDISPQNVMVSQEGEVKLIDFGLALSGTRGELTAPNTVMGKMPYMAPEHARGDRVDSRADQFSVAVMTYELVAGARYYEGLTSQQLWYQAGAGGHVPTRWNDLDPQLAAILGRALSPARDHRYLTCGDLAAALREYARVRGFHQGTRDLRELVNSLFAAELASLTAPLRKLAGVEAPKRETPGFEVEHIATTVPGMNESATLTAAAAARPTGGAQVLTAADASTQMTAVATPDVESPSPARGRVGTTALVVVGLLVAGALGFLLRGGESSSEPVEAVSVPAVVDLPIEPPGTQPDAPQPSSEPPTRAEPPTADPAEPARPAHAIKPAPSPTSAKRRTRRAARKAAPSKPAVPKTFAGKLKLLRSCSESCAKPALAKASKLLELTQAETADAKAAVDACARRCAK